MTRIGIIVDHPKRDLNGCILVAYELARRGAEAVLLPHYEQGIEAPLLGLDAVIMNNARPHYRELFGGYREAGTAIFVLDTEGGVLGESGFNSPERIAQRFRESEIGRFVDGYLFWGQRLYDAFREHGGLPAEKLSVTGCPRYDVCHPIWRGALPHPSPGFFLINTNFNAVNPLLADGKNADRQPLRSQGVTDAEIDGRYRAAVGVFERFVPELHRVVRAYPRERFILRPHPFERDDVYRHRFADCPNLTVDGEGDVMSVLSASRAMLHVNCGTSVEATFLGVLPVMLEYANNDAARAMNPLPSRISKAVWSFEELCRIVEQPETAAREFPFAQNFTTHVRSWFFDNDGRAAARVAEWLIERTPRSTAPRPTRLPMLLRSGQRRPSPVQRAQGVLAAMTGSVAIRAVRETLDPGRAQKRFDYAQVAEVLERFRGVDPRPAPVEAARLTAPATRHRLLSISIRPTG